MTQRLSTVSLGGNQVPQVSLLYPGITAAQAPAVMDGSQRMQIMLCDPFTGTPLDWRNWGSGGGGGGGSVNSVNGVTPDVNGDVELTAGNVGAISTAARAAANGVASLDANARVPVAQLGSGTADSSKYLTGAGAWATLPTSPVSSVAGRTGDVIVGKADVGLGSVDNTSDATKNSASATLTNKTINGANNTLTVRVADISATGTPSATTFLCGDGSWKTPAGGGGGSGTVTNGANLVDNALVVGDGGSAGVKTAAAISVTGAGALQLGTAGTTVGSLNLANATSGTVSLQPVTGALGSNVITVPAVTGTLLTTASTGALTSIQLRGLITNPSGTGLAVFGTSPALVTPTMSNPVGTLTTPAASAGTVGTIVSGLNAAATVTQFQAVYVTNTGTLALADADGTGTRECVGLATSATVASGANCPFTDDGVVRLDSWTWTPGGLIYLSTTAGGLTQTAPTASGATVKILGRALTATVIRVKVDPTSVVVS